MKDLKTMFPRASADFMAANDQPATLTLPNPQTHDLSHTVERQRGTMNKTESEFAFILEAMKRKGEILRYEFEGITLRFANVKYTPDFVVFGTATDFVDGDWQREDLKFIEVKGPFIKGNRERAVERFRHAKTYWPEFTFEMHQKTKEGWKQIL